jgi:hypothetical protein
MRFSLIPRNWLFTVLLMAMVEHAGAALTIDAVTLDGGASVTVAAGASISVEITETNTGGSNWRSTQFYTVPAGSAQCINHGNSNGNGTDTRSISVTAPSVLGTYDALFVASSNNSCGGTQSGVYTLPGGIVILPAVVSIDRGAFNVTTANAIVTWTVTFNGAVSGVDSTDFALVQSGGTAGASITDVSGGGATWTVTANTGTGSTGSLRLDLVDDDSIAAGGVALGGAGAGNGNFSGQSYTLLPSTCTGGADVIFCDDFERSNPEAVGNGWTVIENSTSACNGIAGNRRCAGIDSDIPPFDDYANPRANPTRSLFTRWNIVTVESPAIDLAGRASAELSFWIRRGHDSFSECPEAAGENYLVQYYASDGTWKILAQYPSSPSAALCDGKIFLPVVELPADALHADFRMRFYQPSGSGSSGSGGAPGVRGYDYWHMDNVIIREKTAPSFVGAFCDNFEGGLGRWSISAEGAQTGYTIGDASLGTLVYQSANYSLDLRWGYVSASTFKTDLTGVSGNITYWVRSGTNDTRDPDSGENLLVEYLNDAGNWTTLATYLGSVSSGATYNGSHAIPADAKHANFRLRFRHLNASGYDRDYWHVDDVCVGDLLPTADLALAKSGGTLVPGSSASYVLSVTNHGPGQLSGSLEIIDTLPSGLSYLAHAGTGWACSANAQVVTCNWSGTLANGEAAPPLTLTVNVAAGVSGTITNTATVSGTVVDNVPGNNTATHSTSLFTPAYVFTDKVCTNGVAVGSGANPCNLVNWSPQTAGIPLSGIHITAVNGAGVPTQLSGSSPTSVSLQFALSCHNPVAHAGVQAIFSASGTLPLCAPNGATPTNWTTAASFTFPAATPSIGPYDFGYDDVGRVELFVRNSTATAQIGTSNAFVVKPYGFLLSLACAAHFSPEASAFCPSGETLAGTVTAVRHDGAAANNLGAATPNFGRETTAQLPGFAPNLVAPAPADGGTASAFADIVFLDADADGTWENGEGIAFAWPEVGTIRFTPVLNYLGAGDITAAGKTDSENHLGAKRFYPHHMALADNGSQEGLPASDLTYYGQPFKLGFTLAAQNKDGDAVRNYGLPGYTQRATGAALSVAAENADDGMPLGAAIVIHPAGTAPAFAANWPATAGAGAVATFAASDYRYPRVNPAAPLDALQIGIRFVDDSGDAVPLANGDMNQATAGACAPAACDALALLTTRLRYGRLRLLNFYGSELLPPRVEYRAEYWDGNRWMINAADGSTTLAGAHLAAGGLTVNNIGVLANGIGFITFNLAPAGSYDIAANLNAAGVDTSCNAAHGGVAANMGWLQGFWSAMCGGVAAWAQDPGARVKLGSPRTAHIYLRERY